MFTENESLSRLNAEKGLGASEKTRGTILILTGLLLLVLPVGLWGPADAFGNGPAPENADDGHAVQALQEESKADPELAEFLKKMDSAYQTLKSFKADFDQVSETKTVRPKRHSSGKVYFLKPDKMRWRYEVPEVRDVYLLGEKMTVFLPSQNMVMEQTLEDALQGTAPAQLFMGVDELSATFTLSRVLDRSPDEEATCLRLIPKKKQGIAVKEILLWIGKEDFLPLRSESTDILGNRTILTFRNGRANPKLGQGLFRFQIPPDAEVVTNPY